MSEQMPVIPKVLTWAREHAGYCVEDLTNDFKKIKYWEEGLEGPTYPQLERLADKFKVPVATFFLPEPPDIPRIEKNFRTLIPKQFNKIPPPIRLLLRKASAFQMALEELNGGKNFAKKLITRDLIISEIIDTQDVAEKIRGFLTVPLNNQFEWNNLDKAFKEWRKALYKVGVYVFKDQFKLHEYHGFCLYHEEFPIIYVNNSTSKARQIFTLFHELAHLMYRTSGINTMEQDDFHDNYTIEINCNQIAAEVLVPDKPFYDKLGERKPTTEVTAELAKLFSVSREVIFRKFLERGHINQESYDRESSKWKKIITSKNGGRDYYKTKITYLGKEYITLAFQRYYQNQIDINELSDILDTKPKNLTALEDNL